MAKIPNWVIEACKECVYCVPSNHPLRNGQGVCILPEDDPRIPDIHVIAEFCELDDFCPLEDADA